MRRFLLVVFLAAVSGAALAQDPFPSIGPMPPHRRWGTVMEANGLKAVFNMPDALKSEFNGREEKVHSLPPYAEQKVYRVDDYPACPKYWVRSDEFTASYFVPVQEGKGAWIDLNANRDYGYHLAAVLSIQGVNPVDGKRSQPQLVQYNDAGPDDPPQNYLATTGTPWGMFWLDGFRDERGVTRQFVFTSDVMRSVAAYKLGVERTFNLGILFYRSREPRVVYRPTYRGYHAQDLGLEAAKSPEVAAGAKISQRVYRDPQRLDFWQRQPVAKIVLQFVTQDQFAAITGRKYEPFRERRQGGALNGVPVGN